MKYELEVLRSKDFEKFVAGLSDEARARLTRDITFLKEQGGELRMPYAKKFVKIYLN